jgi:L-seryl-tRNA(Ser) seleniumtransferase
VGSEAAVARIEADPLMRAMRVDKMTLAALDATLRLAVDPALGNRRIPLWAFLNTPLDALRSRAQRLAEAFRAELGLNATVVEAMAFLGGGSRPAEPLPTSAVRVASPFAAHLGSEAALARALRLGDPPVLPRVQGGAVLFDLRALPEADDHALISAVRGALVPATPEH